MPRSLVRRFPNFGILFSVHLSVVDKILRDTVRISDEFIVEEAATVSEAYELAGLITDVDLPNEDYLKFIITGTIDRYAVLWGIRQTRYVKRTYRHPVVRKDDLRDMFERRYSQAKSRKIVLSGIRHFEAFFDEDAQYMAGKSTVIVRGGSGRFDLWSLLAILNSKPMRFYIRQVYGALSMDGGINFTAPMVSELPLPHVDFAASDSGKSNQLVSLYESGDYESLLGEIKHLKHNSPILHDILKPLASVMSETKERKNDEIRKFIEWLEREIGARVEDLSNRTKLMSYHDLDFGELSKILKENRKKIPVNPSNREFQENLQREFSRSLNRLHPMKNGLEATDRLIDQIVCRLYDLTEDETREVEGSD